MGRNKNNLTESDVMALVAAKIKEPGLNIGEIYTGISHIHAKPKAFYFITIALWFLSIMGLIFCCEHSTILVSCLLNWASSIIIIVLEAKHRISEIPWIFLLCIEIMCFVFLCEFNSATIDWEFIRKTGLAIINILS